MSEKFDKLRLYKAKQNLTGKIFDFEEDESRNKILITRYHDVPNRKEVTIPDFVDEISNSSHLFSECRYIEKIIMHSNVHGVLYDTFRLFKGEKIDLSEFDTSNIEDMDGMFASCEAKSIRFGDLFNTSKVMYMSNMFFNCKVDELDLNGFDTSNVESMKNMFYFCKASKINFGDNFDTSRVTTMDRMFSGCNFETIELCEKFNTHMVSNMDSMFSECEAKTINLGENFYTNRVADMLHMFNMCCASNIYLGNKFEMGHISISGNIFNNCCADVYVGKELSEYTLLKLKSFGYPKLIFV